MRNNKLVIGLLFLLCITSVSAAGPWTRLIEQNFTSNVLPSPYGVATTSEVAALPAWRSFDTLIGDGNSNSGDFQFNAATGTITLDLGSGNSTVVNAYNITATGYNGSRQFDWKNWTFEGSSDNSSWTVLDIQSGITFATGGLTKQMSFSNTNAYRYYRWRLSLNNGGVGASLIAELRLLRDTVVATPSAISWSFNETNATTVNHNGTTILFRWFNVTNSTSGCNLVSFASSNVNLPIDSTRGFINLSGPNISKTGNYSFNVTATDNCSNTIAQYLLINVSNIAPTNSWTNQGFNHNVSYINTTQCVDPDNDAITYSGNVSASILTHYANGTIYSAGGISTVGTWYDQIGCSDTNLNTTKNVSFSITNNPPSNTWGGNNQTFNHNVSRFVGGFCSDPDNDAITYSSNTTVLPIATNGSLNFTAGISNTGIYYSVIGCSDTLLNTSNTTKTTITNTAPVNTWNAHNQTFNNASNQVFGSYSYDPDNDAMTCSLNVTVISINNNATISYTSSSTVGHYYPEIACSDTLQNTSVLGDWNITAAPPVIMTTQTIYVKNIVNGSTISTFCINAIGTNTTQNICTTNTTVQFNTTGIYDITSFSIDMRTTTNDVICYQEQANVSTACGGIATGNYGSSGTATWVDLANSSDGDYNTRTVTTNNNPGRFYVNYTIPTNASLAGSTWQTKLTDGVTYNWSSELTANHCRTSTGSLEFFIDFSFSGGGNVIASPGCTNESGHIVSWASAAGVNRITMYEESMFWNTSTTIYPTGIYFNQSIQNYNFSSSNSLTFNVTQGYVNVSVYRLYLNSSIATFNITNNLATNTTTAYNLYIPVNNGSNNIKVDVPGNYSLNGTCTGTILTYDSCAISGVYDARLTIGAKVGSSSVSSFRIVGKNTSLFTYNQTTTNHSLLLPVLQGYLYTVFISESGYANQNTSLFINTSTYLYNFSLRTANSFNITFIDEENGSIINWETVYFQLISDPFAANYTTTNGTLYLSSLVPATYTMRYTALNYIPRFYLLTLTNNTFLDLNLSLLRADIGNNITITVVNDINNPVENATVKVLKYDITTNSYVINQIGVTNFEGITTASVELNNEYYKFIVDYQGQTVLITDPSYIYSTSIQLRINTNSQGITDYFQLQNITGIIDYTNSTRTATFTYTDASNTIAGGCLVAYRIQGASQTFYNSTCSSASSASLLMTLENSTLWQYYLIGNVTLNGQSLILDNRIISFDEVIPESSSRTGLFILFLLLIVSGFISVYSIEGSVVMAGISVVMTSALHFTGISIEVASLVFLISLIVAGIIGWKGNT